MLPEFPDGAWLCELAAAGDPDAMVQVVAAALGVQSYPGAPLEVRVREALRERRLLVVLDNCEHLLDTASRLADGILRECPGVRILATSREPLDIGGERVVRVRSLPLPEAGAALEHAETDAVRLSPSVRAARNRTSSWTRRSGRSWKKSVAVSMGSRWRSNWQRRGSCP